MAGRSDIPAGSCLHDRTRLRSLGATGEPTVAGWALAGLVQVDMDSRVRHIRAGRRGVRLRDAVAGDVRQAAELLETGLASLSRGTQTGGAQRPACA
jgi:hypothetical protein